MPRNPKKPPTTRPRVRRGNQEDADKFRGELIAAALGLFQDGGLSAVTMRAVADTVGVSAMTPYRYFASRAELLTGIWASVVGAMHEQVAAAVDSAKDKPPSEKQRASCSAFLGYWESNPDHYRLVYLTEGITLEPGDMIFTGTPSGVGHARKPDPIWMKAGDKVEVEVQGIGVLRNPIEDEKA